MIGKRVERLLFVYNADSGKWNAVVDSAKKLLLINGCPLCSLTHGLAGERAEWSECKQELGVPVDYVHRNEVSSDLAKVVEGNMPCVVAEAGGEFELLLSPAVIARCRGSIADLKGKLLYHASTKGLKLDAA